MVPNWLRRAATMLWLTGAGLAVATGVLAAMHSKPGYAAVYAAVATGLVVLAVGLLRRQRIAEVVTLVLLGSQVVGVVGTIWELTHFDDASIKARHLHDIGVNYRLALVGNLAFSLVASTVFLWAVARWRTRPGHGRR